MQKGKRFWYILAVSSAASLLLLGTGTVLAVKDSLRSHQQEIATPPKTPTSTPAEQPAIGNPSPTSDKEAVPVTTPGTVKGDYRIVGLGDSLTRGMGDANGKGYIGYLADGLGQKTKGSVKTTNLGISGMKSPELVEYVKSPDVQKEIRNAHLITLSIGGNDLTRGVGSIQSPNAQLAAKTIDEYLKNLDAILKEIRTLNKQAPILFVGLYNPFPLTGDSEQLTLQVLDDWNTKTGKLLRQYPYVLLVPTQDLFQWNAPRLLAEDHFHPNAEGYKAIADRMLQNLN